MSSSHFPTRFFPSKKTNLNFFLQIFSPKTSLHDSPYAGNKINFFCSICKLSRLRGKYKFSRLIKHNLLILNKHRKASFTKTAPYNLNSKFLPCSVYIMIIKELTLTAFLIIKLGKMFLS